MSLERFMELFQGRQDAFAEQQEDGSYRPVRQTMTRQDYIYHGNGDHTYGIYTVKPAGQADRLGEINDVDTTKLIVFDIDTMDMEPRLRIIRVLKELLYEGQWLIEFSGRKGFHIWLFFENWEPAVTAYRAGRAILQRAKVQCEVFPKQSEVVDLGNLIKLPLGIHRFSHLWSEFFPGDSWTKVQPLTAAQLSMLENLYQEDRPDPRDAPDFEGRPLPPCMRRLVDRGIAEGARDVALFSLAIEAKRQGQDEAGAIALLLAANDRNEPPLPEYVIRQKVRSAYNKPYQGLKCELAFLHETDSPLCSTACPRYRPSFGEATQDGPPPVSGSGPSARFKVGDTVSLVIEGVLQRSDGRTAFVLGHRDATNKPVMVI